MTTTTLRLPPRIARLPQLRQIVRGGLAARGAVGAGLAANAVGAAGIPGATAWWKANSLSLNDGDAISTWIDSSGHGYNATQSGTPRPIYKSSIWTSNPVVRFDGSTQWMTIAVPQAIPSFVYAVVDTTNLNSGWRSLLNRQAISTPYPPAIYVGRDNNNNFKSTIYGNTDAAITHSQAVTRRQIARYRLSTGEDGIRIDNGAEQTVAYTHANVQSWITINGPYLPHAGRYDLAELLIYNAALSAADDAAIMAYLNAKYAVY